ncbi:hypothetical protein [Halopseudomonas pelagia]|uniref:hypothetical protein n=1 Tax=Halopseudomonas pelagia TaxID=553151 RepID=UPI0003A8A5B4|nr:hypothetical protein [Halopseudomonas pelagia]
MGAGHPQVGPQTAIALFLIIGIWLARRNQEAASIDMPNAASFQRGLGASNSDIALRAAGRLTQLGRSSAQQVPKIIVD